MNFRTIKIGQEKNSYDTCHHLTKLEKKQLFFHLANKKAKSEKTTMTAFLAWLGAPLFKMRFLIKKHDKPSFQALDTYCTEKTQSHALLWIKRNHPLLRYHWKY